MGCYHGHRGSADRRSHRLRRLIMQRLLPHRWPTLLRNPVASAAFALGHKARLHRAFVRTTARFLFGDELDRERLDRALDELEADDLVSPRAATGGDQPPVGNYVDTTLGKWLYCALRLTEPEVVVETGVAHGTSSWLLLNALEKNGRGRLCSIDLPNRDTRSEYDVTGGDGDRGGDRGVGWMVPDELRPRWRLELGSATELLPKLLDELGRVDVFFHDSDHSYEHMQFEFRTTYRHVAAGGLIISDDVQLNPAFDELLAVRGLRGVVFRKGAVTRKP